MKDLSLSNSEELQNILKFLFLPASNATTTKRLSSSDITYIFAHGKVRHVIPRNNIT